MPGYVFRARRMIRGMGHMLFPRYIQREARDFFYLTSRAILPGAPLAPRGRHRGGARPGRRAVAHEGACRSTGFPTPWRRRGCGCDGDARGCGSIRARPTRLAPGRRRFRRPGTSHRAHAHRSGRGGPRDAHALVARRPLRDRRQRARQGRGGAPRRMRDDGARARRAPTRRSACRTRTACSSGSSSPRTRAPTSRRRPTLDALLARLGCSAPHGGARVARRPFSAAPWTPPETRGAERRPPTVRLVRASPPDAHPIFADTPIVPIQVWQPLQMKRVRYFYKPTASTDPLKDTRNRAKRELPWSRARPRSSQSRRRPRGELATGRA